jgi:hypothetical protein
MQGLCTLCCRGSWDVHLMAPAVCAALCVLLVVDGCGGVLLWEGLGRLCMALAVSAPMLGS